MINREFNSLLLIMMVSVCFSSCAFKKADKKNLIKEDLGVVGFMQPKHNWECLSGFNKPIGKEQISENVLNKLNKLLKAELGKRVDNTFQGVSIADQCKEIVLFEQKGYKLCGVEFWTQVGRCMSVRYLLIPQLREWQQREGGEWGVKEPAKVVFDLYLLDVQQEQLADKFHFEQEQKSLTENLLQLKTFIKRKGKWIEAEKLAKEGLSQGCKELGL